MAILKMLEDCCFVFFIVGTSAHLRRWFPRVAASGSVLMGYLNNQGVDRGVLRVPAVTQRPSVDADGRR